MKLPPDDKYMPQYLTKKAHSRLEVHRFFVNLQALFFSLICLFLPFKILLEARRGFVHWIYILGRINPWDVARLEIAIEEEIDITWMCKKYDEVMDYVIFRGWDKTSVWSVGVYRGGYLTCWEWEFVRRWVMEQPMP